MAGGQASSTDGERLPGANLPCPCPSQGWRDRDDRLLHFSGPGSLLQLPSSAVLAAQGSRCPLTKRVPDSAPNWSPRSPGPGCRLSHRHRTISPAEDLAVSQVSDHKLCSCLPAPEPSELAQVLAKILFTWFFGCHRPSKGRAFVSCLARDSKHVCAPFWALGRKMVAASPWFLCISLPALLQPGGWRMIYSLAEKACASTGRDHGEQEL